MGEWTYYRIAEWVMSTLPRPLEIGLLCIHHVIWTYGCKKEMCDAGL